MSILIIIGLLLWAILAIHKSKKQKREALRRAELDRRTKEQIARIRANAKVEAQRMRAVVAEQQKQAKEQARQAAILAKHEEEIEKLKFRMEQAEADILAEQNKLDHYTARLSALDEELAKINSDIEYYQLANKVDAEKKAKAEKAKIEDKIFSFEEKVRACEKRMSKAVFVKEQAERKIA